MQRFFAAPAAFLSGWMIIQPRCRLTRFTSIQHSARSILRSAAKSQPAPQPYLFAGRCGWCWLLHGMGKLYQIMANAWEGRNRCNELDASYMPKLETGDVETVPSHGKSMWVSIGCQNYADRQGGHLSNWLGSLRTMAPGLKKLRKKRNRWEK